MIDKGAKSIFTLKQFILKQEVKTLYRRILKTIRKVQNPVDREQLRNWTRSDFRNNCNVTDEAAIKMLIKHGEQSLKELETSINLSK